MLKDQLIQLQDIFEDLASIKKVYMGAQRIEDLNKNNMPAVIIEIGDTFSDPSRSGVLDRYAFFDIVVGILTYETNKENQLTADDGMPAMYEIVLQELLKHPTLNSTCYDWAISRINQEYTPGNLFDIRAIYITLNVKTEYRSNFGT